MHRILISDQVSTACVDYLKNNFHVDYRPGLSSDQLEAIAGNYEGWIVRSATKLTAAILEKATRLKVIGRAGAGVDNIDVDAATRRGIIVMNTPGGNTISTAEHAVAMIMALARNIPQADRSVKSGEWKRSQFTGSELFGKQLGIVGIGKVGREVAIRMKAFGMNVIGHDPVFSPDEAAKLGIQLVSLEELLRTSDFISIHAPLTKSTENLINEVNLQWCKRGVRIINCARGGIIDETALFAALKDGKVGGAALDVFTQEPPGKCALLELPSVVATPHLGASTEEAQEKVAMQIAEQVSEAFSGRTIRGAVNMIPIGSEIIARSESFLVLASRLGALTGDLFGSVVRRISISYYGDILDHPTELLTRIYIAGFLGRMMEGVNIVNAPAAAASQGIEVAESRSTEHTDFTQLISVRIATAAGDRTISGALYGKRDARLVGIDDYVFDSQLTGMLLKLSNEDQPGMIGRLGTILGNHNINIAQMALGRRGSGGGAMTILNVDQPVPAPVIEELAGSGFSDISFIDLTNLPLPHDLGFHQA